MIDKIDIGIKYFFIVNKKFSNNKIKIKLNNEKNINTIPVFLRPTIKQPIKDNCKMVSLFCGSSLKKYKAKIKKRIVTLESKST